MTDTPKRSDGRVQFNAITLADLGRGNVGLVINHGLRQLIRDVVDRPADKGKRVLNIKIMLTPDLDASGKLDCIDVNTDIKAVVPTRRNTRPYKILPMADGTAIFTPSSPDDPRQLPLPLGGPTDGAEPTRADELAMGTGSVKYQEVEGSDTDTDDEDGEDDEVSPID